MGKNRDNKTLRILKIYHLIKDRKPFSKQDLMAEFGVSLKTVTRDIQEINCFLADYQASESPIGAIEWDGQNHSYKFVEVEDPKQLTLDQVQAISKILLASRAFSKTKMEQILEALKKTCHSESHKDLLDFVKNEMSFYVEVRSYLDNTEKVRTFQSAVRNRDLVTISYLKEGSKTPKKRLVEPVAVMFSEFYFYLIAYIADRNFSYPTIFRMDRIDDYKIMNEKFKVRYENKFDEAEFRKRLVFMTAGELETIEFEFKGRSLEGLLDRMPTAEIVTRGSSVIVKVEGFGEGIRMWLKSQSIAIE